MNTLRPLGFGEILDRAFALYRRNFAVLFGTALIGLFPVAVLVMALPTAPDPAAALDRGAAGAYLLVAPLIILAGVWVWAALTRQASQAMTGEPVSIADGFRSGLRALLPVVGASIGALMLFFVVIVGVALAFGLVGALAGLLLPGGLRGTGGVVAAAVGGLGGLVGMTLWYAGIFAVLPVIVVERSGPLRALRRSWTLSRGGRVRIVAVMVVAWLITYLPTFAVMMMFGFATAFGGAPGEQASFGALALAQLANVGVSALTTPFFVGVFVVLYFDRRVRTEAFDIETTLDDDDVVAAMAT
ncbi:MAG: hypothetical protein ACODAE_10900 [Gemmatimonadota bacterium]